MELSRVIELIAAEKFYLCGEWKQKRKNILERDHYECQRCRREKHEYKRATTVHHIKHLKEHPELAFEDSNLESLCNECHNEEHPEKFKKYIRPKKWDDERW